MGVLGVLTKAAALGFVMGGLSLSGCFSPRHIEYEVRMPERVEVGERFQIDAYVKNIHPRKVQTLRDIDIDDSLSDGFIIDRTSPDPKGVMYLDLAKVLSFTFDEELEPGESEVITFWCEAKVGGFYAGTVDICINKITRCIYAPAMTIIE